MKKTLLAAALSGGAALAAGAYYAGARLLTDGPMDRVEPALMRLVEGRLTPPAKPDPCLPAAERASKELRAVPMERVVLKANDGTPLVGHWWGNENAERVIVAMHGWHSSWDKDFGASAQFWHANGCAVLYAEERGQGESGGNYIGFGLLERFDCVRWAQWAAERTEGRLPVYLAGVSMGATTVMLASGLGSLPPQVRGVMADCGFTSMDDILRHVVRDNRHMPYDLFRPAIRRLCKKKIGYAPDDAATTDVLRKSTLPLLLVHGEADTFVPPEMSARNYDAAAGPKSLLLVPGARHGMSYLKAPARYEAAVMDFWKQ